MSKLAWKAMSLAIMISCCLVARLIVVPSQADVVMAKGKVRQWQKGILTDITQRDASRMIKGTSQERTIWTYTVDDGHFIWKLDRDTMHRDKPLIVTINAPVEFALEGQKAYMKDDSGEEHSLSVQSKALKSVPSQ